MSLPKETGLFARQESIPGLVIPQWVTVFVSDSATDTVSSGEKFLSELMTAIATVGTVGVTFVVDVNRDSAKFERLAYEVRRVGDRLNDGIRPYFRHIICTRPHYEAGNREAVESGALVALTSGPAVFCGKEQAGRSLVVLDVLSSIIARTSRPNAMFRDIYANDALSRPVSTMPHWTVGARSKAIRRRLEILLLINSVCKPAVLAKDSFFRATEFADTTIANVVNDRALQYKLQPI